MVWLQDLTLRQDNSELFKYQLRKGEVRTAWAGCTLLWPNGFDMQVVMYDKKKEKANVKAFEQILTSKIDKTEVMAIIS